MYEKSVTFIKWSSTIVGTVATTILGGNDNMLGLLYWLVISDFILGMFVAIKKHSFSPIVASAGFVTKLLYFLVIALCVRVDIALGTKGMIRNLGVMWFLVSEGASVVENLCMLKILPEKLAEVFASFKNGFSIRLIDIIKKLVNSSKIEIEQEDKQ